MWITEWLGRGLAILGGLLLGAGEMVSKDGGAAALTDIGKGISRK
jgi:hypothetical protein